MSFSALVDGCLPPDRSKRGTNIINEDEAPVRRRQLPGGRTIQKGSDTKSIASRSTVKNDYSLCQLLPEAELVALDDKIREAAEKAKEKIQTARKDTVVNAGNKARQQIIKKLTKTVAALEHPMLIMRSQHEAFSIPKNCSRIEVRKKFFSFNGQGERKFDDGKDKNMFLSHDKYRQGNCPYSEEPLGDLSNVYICQIAVRHIQNRTKDTYGVTFNHKTIDGERPLHGATTFADTKNPDGSNVNQPYHFVVAPGYTSVKDHIVVVSSCADNEFAEMFPYMTASEDSISLGTDNTKAGKERACSHIHPIIYWVECNHMRYKDMPEPRREPSYAYITHKTYRTALTELSTIMKQVAIVDMETLSVKTTMLSSEAGTKATQTEGLYFEVEIVYLFRAHSNDNAVKSEPRNVEGLEDAASEIDQISGDEDESLSD